MVILTDLSQGCSSLTSTTCAHKYDVFLSFRGIDTRLNFTNHLHKSLEDANLTTFLDDQEIDTGLYLKPELENAIKASRCSIIVVSKNYASSTWCLEELVLILEQHKNSNQIVIPVFYHVDHSDIRKQQNSFGDAMEKHKQRMEAETNVKEKSLLAQKMVRWKKALTLVADLRGKDAMGRLETEFIQEIVDEVYCRLGAPIRRTLPLLIGMDSSAAFITSWLKTRSSHSAEILTIFGMGGMGKTSLAKYVYESHRQKFETSSFIEDISRKCADQFNGLLGLQKQLFGDLSKKIPVPVNHVYEYTSIIENALSLKNVFLVLDDIDSLSQLDALLGNKGFHPGSKIIITTKDASLTERCALFNPRVQPKHTKHELKGLNVIDSLKLLCLHAFKCEDPKEGYEDVSKKLANYCEGHPLALDILGKSLHNCDVDEWEDYIERLKQETDSRIEKVLQISFYSLPSENDKELFKNIACFFVGIDRDFTETILNACNIKTRSGIKNLIDRCLLSISGNNELMMHELVQDMGRNLVRRESPNKPWKRSRLWCHEESFKVLKRKKGVKNVIGLTLDMQMLGNEKLHGSFDLKITDALSKMKNIMLLQLNNVALDGSYEIFPKELRWLSMHGFPLQYIPSELPMENLAVLDMSYSKIESFGMSFSNRQPPAKRQKFMGSSSNDTRIMGSLKILNLSFCEKLSTLSGFSNFPALERLIAKKCIGLTRICESIEQCVELIFIDLSYCNKLEKLPTTLGKLQKVKTLLIDGCNLRELPMVMRGSPQMFKAKRAFIHPRASSPTIVKAIPRDIISLTISLPSSLVRLSLAYNNLSNKSFPMDFSCLYALKELCLSGNPIDSLPSCVRSLPRLESLDMSYCRMLTSVEYPPCTLKKLTLFSDDWQHDHIHLLRKIVFDPNMSQLKLLGDSSLLAPSSIEIEGKIKFKPMAGVEEEVLRSLGWTNLKFLKRRHLGTPNGFRGSDRTHIQMYYEFGIFSTIYGGKQMPKWINQFRSNSGSISFTIPSSPKQLKGLNFCYVQKLQLRNDQHYQLPSIAIFNTTKNHTWIYNHYIEEVSVSEERLIFLSHWMFGKNEMEDGDCVTITIKEESNQKTRNCGLNLVYDDGNMEEDPLSYYKSWNHIIGRDLSSFQSETGEYTLLNKRFCWDYMPIDKQSISHPYIARAPVTRSRLR